MKPTASPSSCGGGDSRDIFSAEYTGLPGHHRIAQPPGGWCQDLWGGTYTGIPRQHRVLKPPGGGSSDIFGADNAEPRRQRNVNQLQSSTVFSNMMETVAGPKNGNPVTGEGYAIANGVKEMAAVAPQAVAAPVVNGSASKVIAAPKVAAPAAPASAPSRGRVPPGGYSSGLW